MSIFTGQKGVSVMLSSPPRRIVSLVPSQTELLYHLGLEKEVVGITHFCVHPPHWRRSKTRVGGTKSIHIDRVKALRPDLIIANKEENTEQQVRELATICPVWVSDIANLQQALDMIAAAGTLTGREAPAHSIIEQVKTGFDQLPFTKNTPRTAYLIWQKPYMTVGGDTFIHDMLARAGFNNIFKDRQRYPVITAEEIRERHCGLLLLSSEPFPFKQKHADAWQVLLPFTKIRLADGEMFSWYGSRLLLAPAYFSSLRLAADH